MTCPGLPRAGIRTQAVVSRSRNPLSLPRPSHFTPYKRSGTSCPGKGYGAQPQQSCPASSLGRLRSTSLSPACSRPGTQVDEMGVSLGNVCRGLWRGGGGRASRGRRNWKRSGRQGGDWTGPRAWPRVSSTPCCCLGGGGGGTHPGSPSGSGTHPRVRLRPAGRTPCSGATNGRPHLCQQSSVPAF